MRSSPGLVRCDAVLPGDVYEVEMPMDGPGGDVGLVYHLVISVVRIPTISRGDLWARYYELVRRPDGVWEDDPRDWLHNVRVTRGWELGGRKLTLEELDVLQILEG